MTDGGGADPGTSDYGVCNLRQATTVGSIGDSPGDWAVVGVKGAPVRLGQCSPDGACSSPPGVLLRDATATLGAGLRFHGMPCRD